jgi:hypothetical protein
MDYFASLKMLQAKKIQLKKFQFTNCLPKDKETAVVNNLSFLPDPLVFPGPLNVTFSVTAKANVDSPLTVAQDG